jgi:hypothetical protein
MIASGSAARRALLLSLSPMRKVVSDMAAAIKPTAPARP